MKLVITADDFGITPAVNKAITEAFRMGIIDQTTALANAPYLDDACRLAYGHGFQDRIGIHFNLTSGMALSPLMKSVPGFCDASGRFIYRRNTKAYITRIEKEAVADECERQIARLCDAGLRPLNFNSHHHVHTEWFIFHAIEPVLKRHGFTSVRISKNIGPSSIARVAYKAIFNRYLKRCGLDATTFFGDYREVLAYLTMRMAPSEAVIEVMTHPVIKDGGMLVDVCSGEELVSAIVRLKTLAQEPERAPVYAIK